nr:MAG TPA: hypothetical protein [Caudoviricetes sp.]
MTRVTLSFLVLKNIFKNSKKVLTSWYKDGIL